MILDVENPLINYKENEPKVVTHCTHCSEALTEQDLITKFEDEYFCEDPYCVLTYMNIEIMEGSELL